MLLALAVAIAAAVVMLVFVLKRRGRDGGRSDLLGPPRDLGAQAPPERPLPAPPAPAPAGWPDGAAPIGDLPDHVPAEARQLLARNRKIEAVKLVRAATGCSLEDAVERVERL